MAWPLLAGARNYINSGNILETILGMRDVALRYKRPFVSEFVNSVYQYTQYTESETRPNGPMVVRCTRLDSDRSS